MTTASSQPKQVPVMEGLFAWPSDEPRLMGNKCKSCGTCCFPRTFRCPDPDCLGQDMEDIKLSTTGKLWSYTVGYYPLPPPYKPLGEFKPFGVAQVEFPEGLRITGGVTGCDAQKDLEIGMDMELVFEKLYDDEEGNEVIGWKFRRVR